MKFNYALQINPVVLTETLDEDVLLLLIFVLDLFGLMDPQLFRLLVYDFGM